MIAVVCSKCTEGFLGLDEYLIPSERRVNTPYQLFKLTEAGWTPVRNTETIQCPNCKTFEIAEDVKRTWKKEMCRE